MTPPYEEEPASQDRQPSEPKHAYAYHDARNRHPDRRNDTQRQDETLQDYRPQNERRDGQRREEDRRDDLRRETQRRVDERREDERRVDERRVDERRVDERRVDERREDSRREDVRHQNDTLGDAHHERDRFQKDDYERDHRGEINREGAPRQPDHRKEFDRPQSRNEDGAQNDDKYLSQDRPRDRKEEPGREVDREAARYDSRERYADTVKERHQDGPPSENGNRASPEHGELDTHRHAKVEGSHQYDDNRANDVQAADKEMRAPVNSGTESRAPLDDHGGDHVEKRPSENGSIPHDSRDSDKAAIHPDEDYHVDADGSSSHLVNLFVRHVAKHVVEEQLTALFSKYGRVDSATVVRDPLSQECRGFAFVKMCTEDAAQNAIDNLCEFEFEGRRISVERAKRNAPHQRTPGAYMGIDRRIRDRYAGMKRAREYVSGYGYSEPPYARRGSSRGRYGEPSRTRYEDRGWEARREARPPHTRMPYEDRERVRRRYDEGPRYPARDLDREKRFREREPPVPRESADDYI